MISNIVVSLFGAAYNWPLGAAISFCMLALVLALLFLSESLEKKWSFSMSSANAPFRASRWLPWHCRRRVFGFLYLPIVILDCLFVQRAGRGRISAARSDAGLVSHAVRR